MFDPLFDFLRDLLPSSWFEDMNTNYGYELSMDDVVNSVHEASVFFNLEDPISVEEGWTTGVINNVPYTDSDDILIFNREQLSEMGITDKGGFDLVMTHEAAHRALQGMDTGYNSHQEELCCDYMAGVRAAIAGLDEGKMEAALGHTYDSDSHPDGVDRVAAIEKGVAYAQAYMDAHDGNPPSLNDCLDSFESTRLYENAGMHAFADDNTAEGNEPTLKGAVDDKQWNLSKAEAAKREIEYYTKKVNEAIAKGDFNEAKRMQWKVDDYTKQMNNYVKAAQNSSK